MILTHDDDDKGDIMKTMMICLFFSFFAAANSITGTITMGKGLEKEAKGGTLFVFAKKAGAKPGDGQMPIAVQRIPDPKFPVKFQLGAENAMVQGTAFEGPFTVSARYSASGNATDKSGPEGSTPENQKVKPGDKDLKIELKKK